MPADNSFAYTGDVQHVTVPAGVDHMTVTAKGGQGGSGEGATQVLTWQTNTQHFTVPAGVTTVRIECRGQAAAFGSHTGGYGGVVAATFTVVPGTVYDVYVAGGSGNPANLGWPNGGYSPVGFGLGESGGGASFVTTSGGLMAQALVVAGGGGMGYNGAYGLHLGLGGDGGYPNGYPGRVSGTGDGGGVYAGQGGTQTAGGAGGLISGSTYEQAGDVVCSNGNGYWSDTQGAGGNGSSQFVGSGGGGWHGGGAGSGGGGGSGHVRADGTAITSTDGGHTVANGTVTFTWIGTTLGGLGGEVTATFSVTPGAVYDVYVADSGTATGHTGWPLGGIQSGFARKGGGGGVSFITTSGNGLPEALIAAGGGGGGSELTAGGGGGGRPDGIRGGGGGGFGGTASAGGVGPATSYGYGDTNSYILNGVVVTRGVGGLGIAGNGNGAGGGGWHGGGAGVANNSGGGGGSGYALPTATAVSSSDASNTGQGSITFSWVLALVAPIGWYVGMIPFVPSKELSVSFPQFTNFQGLSALPVGWTAYYGISDSLFHSDGMYSSAEFGVRLPGRAPLTNLTMIIHIRGRGAGGGSDAQLNIQDGQSNDRYRITVRIDEFGDGAIATYFTQIGPAYGVSIDGYQFFVPAGTSSSEVWVALVQSGATMTEYVTDTRGLVQTTPRSDEVMPFMMGGATVNVGVDTRLRHTYLHNVALSQAEVEDVWRLMGWNPPTPTGLFPMFVQFDNLSALPADWDSLGAIQFYADGVGPPPGVTTQRGVQRTWTPPGSVVNNTYAIHARATQDRQALDFFMDFRNISIEAYTGTDYIAGSTPSVVAAPGTVHDVWMAVVETPTSFDYYVTNALGVVDHRHYDGSSPFPPTFDLAAFNFNPPSGGPGALRENGSMRLRQAYFHTVAHDQAEIVNIWRTMGWPG